MKMFVSEVPLNTTAGEAECDRGRQAGVEGGGGGGLGEVVW